MKARYPRIAILLPTFNGEKYLSEQLDSLLEQSYKNLVVVIRDDGSNDSTLDIIHSYLDRFPDKFHWIENKGSKLGAGGSFSFLMQYVLEHKRELELDKAYMMFCDQDDIWAETKVELEMQCMQTAEADNENIPVLIHSDLKVVSGSRGLIADSFMRYQGLEAARNRFGQILLCNIVTGCTALVNESLVARSLPVPPQAIMHDWWLALVASAFGKMVLVKQPLVEYRQHESNTIGAIEYKAKQRTFLQLLQKIPHMRPEPLLKDVSIQAKAFLIRYRTQLNTGQKLLSKFTSAMFARSGVGQRIFFQILRKI